MHQEKIIILDRKDKRNNSMLKAFDGVCERYQLDVSSHESCVYNVDKNEIVDDRDGFLIFLIHASDYQYANDVKAHLKIWYSGDGGERIDRGSEDYKIRRSIVSRNFLKMDEARRLIQFAKEEVGEMPSFLIDSKYQKGLQVVITIYQKLLGLDGIDDLEQFDEAMKPHHLLRKPWSVLKERISKLKDRKKEIPFFDNEYLEYLTEFQKACLNLLVKK